MQPGNSVRRRSRRVVSVAAWAVASILGGACFAEAQLAASAPQLVRIGRYETGIFEEGAAEIAGYDQRSQRLFVINANAATVDILSLSDPANPTKVGQIDIADDWNVFDLITSNPNSVDVNRGNVVVAVNRTLVLGEQEYPFPGVLALYDVHGNLKGGGTVGFGPDMVTFTPDGTTALVANEGEPSSDYRFDPEGSVSIVTIRGKKDDDDDDDDRRFRPRFRVLPVRDAGFRQFNGYAHRPERLGDLRIFGPGASVAQDLEPEYIAVTPDGQTAYVSLQENNGIAVVDVRRARVKSIVPLGLKDHLASPLDASDRDDAIHIALWPVRGMYQPDALALVTSGRDVFVLGANEGDARDYDGFAEEERVKDLVLDPDAFPDAAALQADEAIGRLTVTSVNGDLDGDGDYDELHAFGGRSFSVWKAKGDDLKLVYDSGSELEEITASLLPAHFNANNDDNDSFDNRSDNKGPEPEGIEVGEVDGRTYAFIGLERIGGVVVYDVTDPYAPEFIQYVNPRNFTGDPEAGTADDLAPEGLEFIPADASPTGEPLLVVANEVSGSVSVYTFIAP